MAARSCGERMKASSGKRKAPRSVGADGFVAAGAKCDTRAMFGTAADERLPTVLVIDDEMVSREVIATVLTMSGYSVHTATSGADALAMLDGGTCAPGVILMDTQMPGLSGRALIQQLRARSKAFLYAISGSHAPPEVIEAADGFLMKPFAPEALQSLLQRHAPKPEPPPVTDEQVVNPITLAQLRNVM